MKKTSIITTISTAINKAGFALKKHSPEIMLVAGVVGVVASGVMACKSTVKATEVVKESKKNIDELTYCVENPDTLPEDCTVEDCKEGLRWTYAHTALELGKLYAPAVALGALSITSIVGSHHILRKRNIALAAAYATVEKTFKEYRNNAIERFGKEVDRQLKYGIKTKEITETVTDEEGNEKTVTKTVEVADSVTLNSGSQYARWFDNKSRCFDPDNHEYNIAFLRAEQNYANDLLKSRKGAPVFLNEIYDRLDIPRTPAGQHVGWIYNPDDPTIDNYIDFGIYDYWRENSRDFVNGLAECILLDFNVDGDVWKLMK